MTKRAHATRTLHVIESAVQADAEDGFRNHLGASVIGKECNRLLWYIFHWYVRVQHRGQMLRLFDRGHLEEHRFAHMLRRAGVLVETRDPVTNKQFRVSAHEGHFGGSLDAKLRGVPDWPDPWLLGEFKTYNKKRFKELKEKGVRVASPDHFVQMQVYMHFEQLPGALYLAVCKDDDELHAEMVEYQREVAEQYIERALRIILAPNPPPRVNESPSWYLCKFCDYYHACHYGAPAAVNCRTCVNARPGPGATWVCTRYNVSLTTEQQKVGCMDHTPYPRS